MSYGSGRGYSGGFNRSFSPKPVETGKEYDVQITETSTRICDFCKKWTSRTERKSKDYTSRREIRYSRSCISHRTLII
jgi:hypothetical protein